jgi:hypothetical protein
MRRVDGHEGSAIASRGSLAGDGAVSKALIAVEDEDDLPDDVLRVQALEEDAAFGSFARAFGSTSRHDFMAMMGGVPHLWYKIYGFLRGKAAIFAHHKNSETMKKKSPHNPLFIESPACATI